MASRGMLLLALIAALALADETPEWPSAKSSLGVDTIVPEFVKAPDHDVLLQEGIERIKSSNRWLLDTKRLQHAHSSYTTALDHANDLLVALEEVAARPEDDLVPEGVGHSRRLLGRGAQEKEIADKAKAKEGWQKFTEGAKKVGEKIAQGAQKVAAGVKNVVVKVANGVKAVVKKVVKVVKVVVEKVKGAIKVIKQIIDVVKAGAKTVNCVLQNLGKSVVGDWNQLISDPKTFMVQLQKRLENFFPEIMKATQMSVEKAQVFFKKVFAGEEIDVKDLAKKVIGDMKKLSKTDPIFACAEPMIEKTEKILNQNTELMLMQSDCTHGIVLAQVGQEQNIFKVVTNWMIDVPWKKAIKPIVKDLFQKLFTEAIPQVGKSLLGEHTYQMVEAGIADLFDSQKKTDVITLKLKQFNSKVSQQKKAEIVQELKAVLTGQVSFESLLKGGMSSLKSSCATAIMGVVNSMLPAWWDWIVQKSSSGVLSISSFVAEEILAEPVPLTQWGMEAIGSGVSEPVKSIWTVCVQLAGELFTKAVPWLVNQLIDALFALPELGAKVAGRAIDELLKPLLKGFSAQVERWIGKLEDMVRLIPPEIMNTISELGKTVLKEVSDIISPKLKEYVETNIEIYKTVFKDWKCAAEANKDACQKAVLVQLDLEHPKMDLLEIKARLLSPLKNGFEFQPVAAPTFEAHLLESKNIPGWMHQHINGHYDSAVHITPSLHQVRLALAQIHRKRFPNLERDKKMGTTDDAYKLIQTSKKLPTLLGSAQASGLLQLPAQGFDNKITGLKLASKINAMNYHLTAAHSSLVQTDFFGDLIKFFEANKKTMECLFKEGSKQANNYAKDLEGKDFGQVIGYTAKVFERDLKTVFEGLSTLLTTSLKKIDQLLSEDTQIDAKGWEELIKSGMQTLSANQPALKCFEPTILQTTKAVAAALDKFMKDIQEKLDGWVSKSLGDVFVKGFESITDGLGKFLLGKKYNKVKLQVKLAFDNILLTITKLLRKGLQHIRDMPHDALRTKAIQGLRDTLNGKVNTAQMVPVIFNIVRRSLTDWVQGMVDDLMPQLFMWVADVGSVLGLPAASVGVDIGVGSASCASEWAGTGAMNIMQQIFLYVQSLGQQAIPGIVNFFTVGLLNMVFDGIDNLVVKPLVEVVLKPADKLANTLIEKVQGTMKTVFAAIPKSIMNILSKIARDALASLQNLINPKLREAMDMNWQVAVALVNEDKAALAAQVPKDPVGDIENNPLVIADSKKITTVVADRETKQLKKVLKHVEQVEDSETKAEETAIDDAKRLSKEVKHEPNATQEMHKQEEAISQDLKKMQKIGNQEEKRDLAKLAKLANNTM